MAYDRLMSDCLFFAVNGVLYLFPFFSLHAVSAGFRHYFSDGPLVESDWWTLKLTPLVIFVLMFPITNMRDFSVFVKLNSYGLICVAYILCFLLGTAIFQKKIDTDHLPPPFEVFFIVLRLLLCVSHWMLCAAFVSQVRRHPDVEFFHSQLHPAHLGQPSQA